MSRFPVHKLVLCMLIMLAAITTLQARQGRQYFFTHYGKQDGLAANDACSVVQDEKGFIWIGTINGLQRFDGTRLLTFTHRPDNLYGMPVNHIIEVRLDRKKRLWVVFANGVTGTFDMNRFLFREAKVVSGNEAASGVGSSIAEDPAAALD